MFDGLDNAYQLTAVQQGMLYEVLKHPDSDIYVAYIVIDIVGPLDSDLLRLAWQQTIQEHETLRTRFLWEGLDEPMQLVDTAIHLDWQQTKSAAVSQEDFNLEVSDCVAWERSTPLDLSETPPIRFHLLRKTSNFSVLIWTVHHLLADDWSTPLVLQTLGKHYQAILAGTSSAMNPPEVEDLDFEYASYVDWLSQANRQKHHSYWRHRLQNFQPSPLKVLSPDKYSPTEKEQSDNLQFIPTREEISLCLEATNAISDLSRQQGATLSSIVHVAWALVLSRHTGQSRAVFGTSVSGRSCPIENIDKAVGLFLNTQPSIIDTDYVGTVGDFLRISQAQLFEQLGHEDLPLAEIQKLAPAEFQQNLFETVLVVESHGPELSISIDETAISFGNIRYYTDSNYPLTVLVFPGQKLQVHLVSPTDQFAPQLIQALLQEFVQVLADLCNPANQLLSDVINQQVLRSHAALPVVPLSAPALYLTIDAWLDAACDQYSNSVSVVDDDREYSYAELKSLAHYCALRITEFTNHKDSQFVGIYLHRGFIQIAAIVGVLKSGSAYVPLDPDWPESRLNAMLQDANIEIVITDAALADVVQAQEVQTIVINQTSRSPELPRDQVIADSVANQLGVDAGEKAAYMIYTSGSTGDAKGVVISHRNLVYSTTARIHYYNSNPRRYLLLSSFAFDSSVAGIFWTLCTGGALVLPGAEQAHELHELERLIDRYQVSHTLCLPSLYSLLLRYSDARRLVSMTTVIVAGEPCSASVLRLHKEILPGSQLYNEYGPTEGTVWATVSCLVSAKQMKESGPQVPIGLPIPGSSVAVVDAYGRVCPVGVVGEIQITGPGVSLGYHRDLSLTQARFITPEISNHDTCRVYRSGDSGFLGFDGQFYFLGRTDNQLKVRGHRIEPGEIEARVERNASVRQAVCSLVKMGGANSMGSEQRLVCYYTLTDLAAKVANEAEREVSSESVIIDGPSFQSIITEINDSAQQLIATELPKSFNVSRFVAVNKIPLLPNGKIDFRIFPNPFTTEVAAQEPVVTQASQTDANNLFRILADLLGVDAVGPQDNFFSLGGDSLTAIRFVAAAREGGLQISIPMVSQNATLGELGQAILEQKIKSNVDGIRAEWNTATGMSPLTPIQEWFFSNDHPEPEQWNMACYFDLKQPQPVQRVVDAVVACIEAHPILVARFIYSNRSYVQEVPDIVSAEVLISRDLKSATDKSSDDDLIATLCGLQSQFDLSQGNLIRFVLTETERGVVTRIAWVAHHLVTDVFSNWQLAHQITANIATSNQSIASHERSVSGQSRPYRDWSIRLGESYTRSSAREVPLMGHAWHESDMLVSSVIVEQELLNTVSQMCKNQSIGIHECLLFVLLHTALVDAELKSIRVDVETHGRDVLASNIDVSESIGWFSHFFTLCHPQVSDAVHLNGPQIDQHRFDKGTLLQFRDTYRKQKQDAGHEFLQNPITYFSRDKPDNSHICLLYNYLAFKLSETDLQLTTLTNSCFRAANSVRSHALDILVTDASEGIRVSWNTDKSLNNTLDIPGWQNRFILSLQSLVAQLDDSAASYSPQDFPDVDMDADELSNFLDSLE